MNKLAVLLLPVLAAGLLTGCDGGRTPVPAEAPPAPSPTAAAATLLPLPDLEQATADEELRQELQATRQQLAEVLGHSDTTGEQRAAAYATLGRLCHAWDLLEPAEVCYRNAALLDPEQASWPYLLGQVYRSGGRWQEAITAFEAALRLAPDDLPTLVNLANLLVDENQLQRARQLLEQAQTIDDSSAAVLFGRGRIELREGSYWDAVTLLEQALQLAPQAKRIHYPLGMAYRELGELAKASAHLEQSGVARPQPADPLMQQVRALRSGSHFQRLRAAAAFREGQLPAALQELQEALARTPDDPFVHLNLGTVLASMGRLDQAEQHLQRSLELGKDPRLTVSARVNLGNLSMLRGDLTAAVAHFRAALKVDPGLKDAHLRLADALLRLGKGDAAMQQLDTLLKLDPREARAYVMLARVLQNAGQYQHARQYLEQSYQQLQGSRELAAALARLLATCPVDGVRDGARAVELARSLYTAARTPANATLLAMALAEAGELAAATELQQATIDELEKAGRTAEAKPMHAYLALYRQGQAVRLR